MLSSDTWSEPARRGVRVQDPRGLFIYTQQSIPSDRNMHNYTQVTYIPREWPHLHITDGRHESDDRRDMLGRTRRPRADAALRTWACWLATPPRLGRGKVLYNLYCPLNLQFTLNVSFTIRGSTPSPIVCNHYLIHFTSIYNNTRVSVHFALTSLTSDRMKLPAENSMWIFRSNPADWGQGLTNNTKCNDKEFVSSNL